MLSTALKCAERLGPKWPAVNPSGHAARSEWHFPKVHRLTDLSLWRVMLTVQAAVLGAQDRQDPASMDGRAGTKKKAICSDLKRN